MRRFLIALAFLCAAPVVAQTNVTVQFNARQLASMTREVTDANATTCNALFVAEDPDLATCLAAGAGAQALARDKYCSRTEGKSHPCGAGASASSNVRIYRSVAELVQKLNDDLEAVVRGRQKASDSSIRCVRWAAYTAAEKKDRCNREGLPDDCELCP